MSEEAWWLTEPNHPDAAAHREFLEEKAQKEAARMRPQLPPLRRKRAELTAFFQLGQFVRKAIDDATAPLVARIVELEARPSMQHRGPWRNNAKYDAGDTVSFQGSGWVCKQAHEGQRPGETRMWQLFVKRGRDAK